MSRRRRTLSILALLIFLLSLWVQPLIAREPPSGQEDWTYSTYHEGDYDIGDDYDDDPFYITGSSSFLEVLRWAFFSHIFYPRH